MQERRVYIITIFHHPRVSKLKQDNLLFNRAHKIHSYPKGLIMSERLISRFPTGVRRATTLAALDFAHLVSRSLTERSIASCGEGRWATLLPAAVLVLWGR